MSVRFSILRLRPPPRHIYKDAAGNSEENTTPGQRTGHCGGDSLIIAAPCAGTRAEYLPPAPPSVTTVWSPAGDSDLDLRRPALAAMVIPPSFRPTPARTDRAREAPSELLSGRSEVLAGVVQHQHPIAAKTLGRRLEIVAAAIVQGADLH
jgi:hypothetical protein